MPMEQQIPKTIDVKRLMEVIHFKPHEFQQKILDCYLQGKKKIVVSAGQRAGKTAIASLLIVLEAMADGKSILVCSPSYNLTERVFEYVRRWLSEFFNQPIQYVARPYPKIELPWKSYIEGKSASEPSQILGKSYNLIIVDEASRIGRDVYQNYLFPRIGELQGRIVLISTPLKKDFFYEEFLRAKEDNAAFQFGTASNPHYPTSEIATFQKQLPKAIYEREFLGVFTDELTSIFPDALSCVNPKLPRDMHPGTFHWIGLDIAKEEDFSAITVADEATNEIIYVEKWNKLPYNTQISKIEGIISRFRPCKVVIDVRGPGAVVGDEIRSAGICVEDWASSGSTSKDFSKRGSKSLLVEKTIALFSSHSISIPNDQGLLDELSSYSYNLSPMGNITYGAPQGLHDDQVESLMMACWNLQINPAQSKKERDFQLKKYNEEYDKKPKYFYPEIENPNYGKPGSPNNPPSVFGRAPKVW